MRILMLNYEFPPLGAGGATSSFNLARNVVRLGHHVDVVTMGHRDVPSREVLDGVHVYRVPSIRSRKEVCHTHEMGTYVMSGTVQAAWLARRHRYDVCNAHFIFPTGPIAYAVRRLGGLPYILTARGSDVPGHNPNRFRFDHQLLGPVWRGLVRDADGVVAVSHHLAERIQAHAPDLAVEVIPNGCSPLGLDNDMPAPESVEAGTNGVADRDDTMGLDGATAFDGATTFGGPNGTPASNGDRPIRILSATRLHEFKGVQYLLEAAERAPLAFEIDVVGDGPYRATLEAQAARGRTPVRFWGWLDRNDPRMKRLFTSSSIFVFPSEREGSPAVIQEAMSAGMAVIAADSAGTPEVVGDAGVLVHPRDSAGIAAALERLAANPDQVDDLGRRARERVQQEFDWAMLAGRYVDLYARVAARGRRGGPHQAESRETGPHQDGAQ